MFKNVICKMCLKKHVKRIWHIKNIYKKGFGIKCHKTKPAPFLLKSFPPWLGWELFSISYIKQIYKNVIFINQKVLKYWSTEKIKPKLNIYSPPYHSLICFMWFLQKYTAQLAGAVEYTNCTTAEGYDLFPPPSVLVYDTKQSDGEVPIMLELWGMRSIPSLSLVPGPHWTGVVAPDRVLSMGQIELNCSFESLPLAFIKPF